MSFLYSILGCLAFAFLGNLLVKKKKFDMGRGTYCGAFPFLGAFVGAYLSCDANLLQQSTLPFMVFFTVCVFVAFIGYKRDYDRIPLWITYAFVLLVLLTAFSIYSRTIGAVWYIYIVLWTISIIFCLKLSSLVYEMPYVLITLTSIMSYIYSINNSTVDNAVLGIKNTVIPVSVFCVSLIVSGFFFIFSGIMKEKNADGTVGKEKRFLPGSSGLFVAGFLLSCMLFNRSNNMALLGLCIPTMVIIFPPALICFMIVTSYFGNKLHKPETELNQRAYLWTIKREKTIIFSCIVFLCLTLGWLISMVELPIIALVADLLLLSIAIGGFIKMFVRKKPVSKEKTDVINILDVKINAITPTETINAINNYNKEKKFAHIITADSLALVRAKEEPEFKTLMEKAELIVPDGAGIVWAADFTGNPLPCRVPGVALVKSICEEFAKNKSKVYFIGSRPGVAEKAAEVLRDEYKVNICGIQHGFFKSDSEEETEIINNIAKAEPDVVLVALGVPRQEWFINKLREKNLHCVAIGVGGSFDVISGDLKRAPVIMQRCGIEWLFRLWLEPNRIGRMIKIPVFVLQILREKWNNE